MCLEKTQSRLKADALSTLFHKPTYLNEAPAAESQPPTERDEWHMKYMRDQG